MDPIVQVALIGVITTLITTAGAAFAVVWNNRRERGGAADAGVEATLRERITLKDEQLAAKEEEIEDLAADRDRYKAEAEEKTLLVRELRAELRRKS